MTFNDHEIFILIMGCGVGAYIAVQWRYIRRIRNHRRLVLSFATILLAWLLSVLEGLDGSGTLNLLEHLAYLCSSVLLLAWCIPLGSGEESRA